MIYDPSPDILTTPSSNLICPVNTIGVMGAGLAKYFSMIFPALQNKYKDDCRSDSFYSNLGITYYGSEYCSPHDCSYNVIGFPTKHHWKDPSDINLIYKGFESLAYLNEIGFLYDVALPRVGCGLGGLCWDTVVFPLVMDFFKESDLHVYLC